MRQAAIGFVRKKLNLEGILTTPQEVPQPYPALVLCHPHPLLGGNMDDSVLIAACHAANDKGVATFRFNFHGVGASEGKFTDDSDAQQDLKSAVNVVRRWPGIDKKRIAVLGYSYGAAVVLGGLKHYKPANSFILIAPPATSVAESRIIDDKRPKLFVGSVRLGGDRIGRDAGKIAEEVLQHLSTLPGAKVKVSLEVQVEVPDGVGEDVVRTVTENCNTLKFTSAGFEDE